MEFQKRVIYPNEFDRLQGAELIPASHPNVKPRMNDIQNKARQSLKGETHVIHETKS